MTTPTTLRGPALRRFVRHYLGILMAAVAGMVVLGPVESMLLNLLGWAELLSRFETYTLVMPTNMTVAMAAWMRFRRHGWGAIVENLTVLQNVQRQGMLAGRPGAGPPPGAGRSPCWRSWVWPTRPRPFPRCSPVANASAWRSPGR